MNRVGSIVLVALVACRPESPSLAREARPLSVLTEADDLDPDPRTLEVRLVAAPLPEGSSALYGYEGQSPGPLLRARVGDRLVVTLENRLTHPASLHWHGLKVPFAMDGVPESDAAATHGGVAPRDSFRYELILTQAGTYWYHPHFDTAHQVEGGLFGAIVVEDPRAPEGATELTLVFDRAWRVPRTPHEHGGGWRLNGTEILDSPLRMTVRAGTVLRARLINAASAGFLALSSPGANGRWIAGDQGYLGAPEPLAEKVLGPGDRAEAEWRVGETGFTLIGAPYALEGPAHGEPRPLLSVEVEGSAPIPAPLAWPFAGASPPTQDPDYADIVWSLQGSDRTAAWRINGESYPAVTPFETQLGSAPIVELRNVSSTEHPFHLHGLVFEVLSVNGIPPVQRTFEDTVHVRIRERVRLRVIADNPGAWMAHCHILPHAEEGMMTILRVRE